MKEENYGDNGQYDYCPICGVKWGDNSKQHKCELITIINQRKPGFDMVCLDVYKDDFLRKIIYWQDMKIRALLGEDASKFNLDLKSNKRIINFAAVF